MVFCNFHLGVNVGYGAIRFDVGVGIGMLRGVGEYFEYKKVGLIYEIVVLCCSIYINFLFLFLCLLLIWLGFDWFAGVFVLGFELNL